MKKSNKNKSFEIIRPYGGKLINLIVTKAESPRLLKRASKLRQIKLSLRSIYDLELLATGAFSPLDKFMSKKDYQNVLGKMRLADGMVFPIPITLPINAINEIKVNEEITLTGQKNEILAIMKVEEIYERDIDEEIKVFGTLDKSHPLVNEMLSWGRFYISGPLKVLNLPKHHSFAKFRLTPKQVRATLKKMKAKNIVAFQTRNPIHRAHEELTKRASNIINGVLLIHPVVGMTKPGDVNQYARIRSYIELFNKYYNHKKTILSLLPLAMRMGGPREAVWHAIIRRNYGASHMIIGRDHAGPGKDCKGIPFYNPYDAQNLFLKFSKEIGMEMLAFKEFVYLEKEKRFEEADKIAKNAKILTISGTQVRNDYLEKGNLLPEWFSRKEVSRVLAETYPPKHKRGFCVWFTGFSSAGKSTIAEILTELLNEKGRPVTLLDGDIVRNHLSKGLGFSKEDRDTNILRIGFVASEIVRHNGIAVCAAISPYEEIRNKVKEMVGKNNFILVFVDTPLKICEKRDIKGMYLKAKRGEIKGFTGIDDPYEIPQDPDIVLKTSKIKPEINAKKVLRHLQELGLLKEN